MTGCVGLYDGGGPVIEGKVTMSADLNLTYKPVTNADPNTVLDLSGEYCFGQDWGCENATAIDGEGFAVPFKMKAAGHLLELFGNIATDVDGTNNFGPLPTGESWGAGNGFYLLPGGCRIFEENLNSQGFPNPAPLSTLRNWLPPDALHLASVPLVDRDFVRRNRRGSASGQGRKYLLGSDHRECRRLRGCDLQQKRQWSDRQRNPGPRFDGSVRSFSREDRGQSVECTPKLRQR